MERKIILLQNVRVLERSWPNKPFLNQTRRILTKGSEVTIGEPVVMNYDHREQLAVPLAENPDSFLIVSEIGELNKKT